MSNQELFPSQNKKQHRHAPLADRMRPTCLDEFVGQADILAEESLLLRAIQSDSLPSMILWGPPGCGKTALATVIANASKAAFAPFSAVMEGVKQIREIIQQAEKRAHKEHRRTILFIDEIHRMNKAQQDSLLPHVEHGTVTLIGATTENPSFEVISALLSRCRVFVLKPLTEEQTAVIIRKALSDNKRGLGNFAFSLSEDACALLCRDAQGDARRAINTLEAAATYLASTNAGPEITCDIVTKAAQHHALLYDRAGEEHYNVISAFIKSLRGSDPSAAVYWMTRMLEAGEDPRFILRRMIIFASEDIGNADPNALTLATSALAAHEMVGLPESALCLTQAATYLACASKSNSALVAYTLARKEVRDSGALPTPMHLRNAASGLMRNLGYGKDYKYPHNFDNHYVEENYLPQKLLGSVYYTPSDNGYEKEILVRITNRRKNTK